MQIFDCILSQRKPFVQGSGILRWPTLGLALLPLAIGCDGARSAQAQRENTEAITRVESTAVLRATEAEHRSIPGVLAPRDTYDLSFPTGGIVVQMLVDTGAQVHRGQVLARIDSTASTATLAQAQQGLMRAERDLARARELATGGSIPSSVLQDAETGAAVARANVSAAGFPVRNGVLRAPADGWVEMRFADPREVVAPGQPVLRLGSRTRGWVLRASVTDRIAARLALGDAAAVTLDAADAPSLGHVVEVAQLPNPATGSFEVEVELSAPPGLTLRTGMVGRVELSTGRTGKSSVPLSALVEADGDQAAVFAVENGRAVKVPVRIAFLAGERAVLQDPLERIGRVVHTGAERLVDGARVEEN